MYALTSGENLPKQSGSLCTAHMKYVTSTRFLTSLHSRPVNHSRRLVEQPGANVNGDGCWIFDFSFSLCLYKSFISFLSYVRLYECEK